MNQWAEVSQEKKGRNQKGNTACTGARVHACVCLCMCVCVRWERAFHVDGVYTASAALFLWCLSLSVSRVAEPSHPQAYFNFITLFQLCNFNAEYYLTHVQ